MGKKTNKNRAAVEVTNRKMTWGYLLAFLAGAVFSEITADPLSDLIFFWRESTGIPMNPTEQIIYWYYIPALMYFILFFTTFMFYATGKVKANVFKWVIIFFAGISMIFSLRMLGFNIWTFLLLLIPLTLLIYILSAKTTVQGRKHRVTI